MKEIFGDSKQTYYLCNVINKEADLGKQILIAT